MTDGAPRRGKRKGDVSATPAQIEKFRRLRAEGWSVKRAATHRSVGMSEAWGYKQAQKDKEIRAELKRNEPPEPKSLEQLDGGVKDLLHDFAAFDRAFFAMRPMGWATDAANQVVEMLTSGVPDYYYVDLNVPPGSGKTTLFTFRIPIWLLCGGGSGNPEFGRALRILLGSETAKVSVHYVMRVRRVFESMRAFSYYDKIDQSRHTAELSILKEFGRFKPKQALGEPTLWTKDQFTVAQLVDIDLSEKEPSVQAASKESGFLGERVDYYSWDDLSTGKNSRTVEQKEELARFMSDEAETRLEPSGVGMLVGQRLGPLDLHRDRLDQTYPSEDGRELKKYHHIVYPAHFERYCDGRHRQWNGKEGQEADGCLLDEHRLSWKFLLMRQAETNYRTVYQQEDSDPSAVLVQRAWLDGGTDPTGYPAPGCFDYDRGFLQWPRIANLINYVTVDPAAGKYWAVEWKAIDPVSKMRFLIYGTSKKMQAGAFLDWNNAGQHHIGIMEELQAQSCELGHPILIWIVEQNAAHKYLFQYEHYRSWRRKWSMVDVVPHTTGLNKADEKLGIEAAVPAPYKQGLVRIPRLKGDLQSLNYVNKKVYELTNYPLSATDDTVLADWFGEFNMERILRAGNIFADTGWDEDTEVEGAANLPRYLRQQRTSATV